MSELPQLPWPTLDWRALHAELERDTDAGLRDEVRRYFTEKRVIGRPTRRQVIACSLFFKPSDPALAWPPPDFHTVHTVRVRDGRSTWWEAYAAPLLENLYRLPYVLPDWDVHLYLAADLVPLVEIFALPQVILHVMDHDSLAAQPGMMWRFLAHDLEGVDEVANLDVEEEWEKLLGASCIGDWRRSNLALFRRMNPKEIDPRLKNQSIYRPIGGGCFCYRPQPDFSMRGACEAFTFAALRKNLQVEFTHPTRGVVRQFGCDWPYYGMDETFLQQAVYPFFLRRGVHTNFEENVSPILFPLDLQAAFDAHPDSVLTHGFGAAHRRMGLADATCER